MSLPTVPIPSDVVKVGDVEVPVRGLSRAEVIRAFNDLGEGPRILSEAFIVACGTGVTPEEAEAWLGTIDNDTAVAVTDRIIELSGLSSFVDGRVEEDPKP